eukprot:4634682-Amphidinium_carterae.1
MHRSVSHSAITSTCSGPDQQCTRKSRDQQTILSEVKGRRKPTYTITEPDPIALVIICLPAIHFNPNAVVLTAANLKYTLACADRTTCKTSALKWCNRSLPRNNDKI